MAELADAPDSKSGSRKRVGVRPSLRAPHAMCTTPPPAYGLPEGRGVIADAVPYDPPFHVDKLSSPAGFPLDMIRPLSYSSAVLDYDSFFTQATVNFSFIINTHQLQLTKEAAHA